MPWGHSDLSAHCATVIASLYVSPSASIPKPVEKLDWPADLWLGHVKYDILWLSHQCPGPHEGPPLSSSSLTPFSGLFLLFRPNGPRGRADCGVYSRNIWCQIGGNAKVFNFDLSRHSSTGASVLVPKRKDGHRQRRQFRFREYFIQY
jgi:hypothetical protein